MFSEVLKIMPGVTALVGSGGKTTLLRVLAGELPGTVLLCTSTHILPFSGIPLLLSPTEAELRNALARHRVICAGTAEPGTGKLVALDLPLRGLADYVLCEADGARMLPLKAHLPHEPVIPPDADRTILVAGLSGLGRPIRDVVHRAERFAALCGASPDDPVTPERLCAVLRAERLSDFVFFNQTDVCPLPPVDPGVPYAAGSLRNGVISCSY